MNGTEILSLTACGVTLKDSRCLLPSALSKLPSTFGLKDLAKGDFPFLFDTPEHDDYVGVWPAAHYYSPDEKKPEEREKFFKWYDTVKDQVFTMPLLLCI